MNNAGRMLCHLDALFDVPDEGTEAQEGIVDVEFAEAVQEGLHLLVLADGQNATVHGRPCVGAQMGLTGLGASACDFGQQGVTMAEGGLECLEHTFFVCLVK